MKKVLVTKGKKEYVEDLKRDVTIQEPQYHYITGEFHSIDGTIREEDIKNGKIVTNRGREFICFDPTFYDEVGRIKRKAQIITPKDVGIILTNAGLNKNSVVAEAGVGSGGLTIYLANFIKQVYSYEINEDHFKIAKKNLDKFDNVDLKLQNITESFFEHLDPVKYMNRHSLNKEWRDKAIKDAEKIISTLIPTKFYSENKQVR